jgi:hypothetical protein
MHEKLIQFEESSKNILNKLYKDSEDQNENFKLRLKEKLEKKSKEKFKELIKYIIFISKTNQ